MKTPIVIFITVILATFNSQEITAQISTDSLLLYLPCNGNAADSSGNNNNGIVHKAVLDTNRFGVPNSAYRFNGIDSYIEIPASPSLNLIQTSDVFSMSAWIKIKNWFQGWNVFPVFERYDLKTDAGWLYEANWASGGILFLSDQTNTNYVGCNYTWTFHQWHHACVVFDRVAAIADFYVDGVHLCSQSYNSSISLLDTTASFAIGRSLPGPDEYADGIIDDVKLYNRALTREELGLTSATAIENDESKSTIRVYPNPAKDEFNIKLDAQQKNAQLVMYNIYGEKVFEQTINSNQEKIYPKLNNGIYQIRITINNNSFYQKLTIQ